MDGQLDPLRRERAELLARAERLRLWSRLVRARTDLLVAQLCPPTGEEEGAVEDLDDLSALVLDAGAVDDGRPYDRAAHLLALREARRALRRREEALADRLGWSTARLVLEGTHGTPSRSTREDGAGALVLSIPRPRGAADIPLAPPPAPAGGWHTPA